jgi:hypothetical protein
MRRYIVILITGLFMSSLILSCKAMGTTNKVDKAEINTPPNVGSNKLSKIRQ